MNKINHGWCILAFGLTVAFSFFCFSGEQEYWECVHDAEAALSACLPLAEPSCVSPDCSALEGYKLELCIVADNVCNHAWFMYDNAFYRCEGSYETAMSSCEIILYDD